MSTAITPGVARSRLETLAPAYRAWISRGATQGPEGAFHGWRVQGGGLSPAYPEITGLALTYLAGSGDARSDVARRAAAWLCERIEADDYRARATDGESIFVFDLGMIATGLRRYADEASDARAAAAASRVLERLAAWVVPGALRPVVAGSPLPARVPRWSTHGAIHLLKLVQCLLLGAEAGDRSARARAAALYDEGTRMLAPLLLEGDLRPYAFDGRVSLHAICYAAEGLWIWGEACDDARARESSRAVVEMLWGWQLADGGLPGFVDADGRAARGAEQGDVLAQALRLAALHGLASPRLDQAVARLETLSLDDPPGRAVRYRSVPTESHLNTWATLFAIQAVDALGSSAVDWRTFV